MNVTEMNDRMLVNTYLNLEDKESRDDIVIELISRGFLNMNDGGVTYIRCLEKRKHMCTLCTKVPWCEEYEPGGLGRGY